MSIVLNDILRIIELSNVRIRLNLSNNSWNALKLYHDDPEQLLIGNFHNSLDRNETQKDGSNRKIKGKIWFKEGQIVIGLAQIENDDWLLIDISKIVKSYNKVRKGKNPVKINTFYEIERISEYEKYLGRLVVNFHKSGAYVTVNGDRINEFIVKEILPDSLDRDIFPGYENVYISWEKLAKVIKKDSWKTALENQKGVYLISDISNGKKYIGSAYGKNMILGRWELYIRTGHGRNKGLKGLPFDHIKKNFYYSILDIFKSTTNDKVILDRENWWKNVLNTRENGYNEN